MEQWKEDYVVKNEFSRPAVKLLGVKGIVMHWTATPGATDTNEHDFFDGKDGGGGRYASAHFFIDRDSATLIIPLDEVAYHANDHPCKVDKLQASANYYKGGGANLTSIGVEMCVEKDGTIHGSTVKRAEQVVAELCNRYKLNPLTDIYRHYDITGKNCPAPWVSHPELFNQFKKDVNTIVHPPKPAVKVATSTYAIEKNDTFWSIEADKKLKHGTLQKLNPKVNADKLQVGQKIRVK
jgi:N-acetylmuramoyl-L-alanine amidase